LRNSEKDAAEQAMVTDFLAAKFSELCRDFSVTPEAEIRKLANVQHRVTTLRGLVKPEVTPEKILTALHPTPAVCGLPRDAARQRIAQLERAPRGMYAGAFGYTDSGTAEFAVAIRSALISENRAVVFGGAGIVEGSDPLAEWKETSWKMRPLLAALGCGLS
jgi:isochorismate synthase EntC